ncbi:TIGR03759 family integrating conjugative element protein [Pseudomonas aeruginosa]
MNFQRLSLLTVAASLCACAATALAQPQPSTTREAGITRNRPVASVESTTDQRMAHDWGLSAEEWTRYHQLMQGPLGTYSPNLDPLTALGIEARSDEERRRLAELQVKAEARRAEKVLSYQRAYDEAWQRAFPNAPRVNLPEARSRAVPGSGRMALFVKDSCEPCDARARDLQARGVSFDVYMVGSRQDDARIRRWAARVGIDPEKVRRRTVTLNHDAGRWLSLGLPGELPAVTRQVNGQWLRE